MGYTLQTTAEGEFDEVVETTIGALADEGFGVRCDIGTEVHERFDRVLTTVAADTRVR